MVFIMLFIYVIYIRYMIDMIYIRCVVHETVWKTGS